MDGELTIAVGVPREDWQAEAACIDVPTEVFFPEDSSPWASEAAKAVCHTCPVRSDCLDFAIAHSGTFGRHGVWGGLTEMERRTEVRARRISGRWTQDRALA